MSDFYDPFDVDRLPRPGFTPPDAYTIYTGSPYGGVWTTLNPLTTEHLKTQSGTLDVGGLGPPRSDDFVEIVGNPHFQRTDGDMAVRFAMTSPTLAPPVVANHAPRFGLGLMDTNFPNPPLVGAYVFGQVQMNYVSGPDGDGAITYDIECETGLIGGSSSDTVRRTAITIDMWLVLRVRSGHATFELHDTDPSAAGATPLVSLDAPTVMNTGSPILYMFYPATWTNGEASPPESWFSDWKWEDDLLTGPGHAGGGAPTNTVAPHVSGRAAVGNVLTVDNGAWANVPTSFTYQWRRDGDAIVGATANSHAVTSGDAGHDLSCDVAASNAGGTNVASSDTITIVGTPPDPIAGAAISVGRETTGIVRLG